MNESGVSTSAAVRPAKTEQEEAITLLVVAGGLQTGGTERHLSLILPRLLESGIRPKLYALGADGPMADPIRDAGIEINFPLENMHFATRLPRPFRGLVVYVWSVFRLWRAIRSAKPDICHCFLPMATIVGGLAARLAGHRLVIASRRSLNHYQAERPLFARVERWLVRGMAAVLGNSHAVTAELAREGVAAERIGLIYNGVAIDPSMENRCDVLTRRRLDISEDALVLLNVANLIPYKGHRDLLAAVALAADSLPQPWVLLCAGRDDGIGPELARYAATLGVQSNLRFLGEYEDVAELYRIADLAILSSHEEGFSNALLEALAAGVPTVATAVGGNVEAISESLAGRLVAPKDPTALAKAICEIGCDADLRQRMRAAAHRRAREAFSLEVCVRQYDTLYRGLLSGQNRNVDAIIGDG